MFGSRDYTMKYRVYAARTEEIGAGWVWIGKPPASSRCIVKITNRQKHATVICEALQIDKNFLNGYNRCGRIRIDQPDSAIVINAWYRHHLGEIPTKSEQELTITPCNIGQIRACLQHPQVVVRLATWLGIISVVLAVVGVVLGVLLGVL
jgi:superoxide dismutase